MKNKRLLSYVLAGTMLFSNITPSLAYTYKDSIANVTNQDITENATSNTTVYAEVGSFFKVTIPKHIILNGTTKSGEYTVNVEGDIAGTEVVKVVPDEAVVLKSANLSDVTAKIEQDKTKWFYGEILADSKVIGNGAIDASGITAGSWNGNFNFNINLEEVSPLMLSSDEVTMGASSSTQIDAYYEGELVNEFVDWNSDNENITVTNGLVETSAAAKAGDTATITVTAGMPSTVSLMTLNEQSVPELTATFTVTIIDMVYTADNQIIQEVEIKAGSNKEVEVTIIPESASKTVTWTQTSVSGVSLIKNGNKCKIKIANDMPEDTEFMVIASYGDFAKILKIKTLANHDHQFEIIDSKAGNCQEDGYNLYDCTLCDKQYTEVVKGGHIASGEWLANQAEHYQLCKYCDTVVKEESHEMGASNCNVCGFENVTVNTANYSGIYDGTAHTASVSSDLENVTFKYGTTEGTYNLTTIPTYTNAGTYTIYYQATHPNYKTTTGSVKVEIEKAEATILLDTNQEYIKVITNSDGTISGTSSDTTIVNKINADTTAKTVKVLPTNHGNAGTVNITVTVNESTNYKAASAVQSVTISERLIPTTINSLGWFVPAGKYNFGYLNSSGAYVADGNSMWMVTNDIAITEPGYYYILGYSGSIPRFCLYTKPGSNGNNLYRALTTTEGQAISLPGNIYLKLSICVNGGADINDIGDCDLRKITFN